MSSLEITVAELKAQLTMLIEAQKEQQRMVVEHQKETREALENKIWK